MSSGTFSSSVQTLTCHGVICASAVARPDTPPGAMSFGMVNIGREMPTRALPITVKNISGKNFFMTTSFGKNCRFAAFAVKAAAAGRAESKTYFPHFIIFPSINKIIIDRI